MVNLKKEIIIRSIKIVDIFYLTALYFVIGYYLSHYVNKLYPKFNKEDNRNKLLLFLEVLLQLGIIGILFYLIRNISEYIPFPLDGVYGFKHKLVKELNSSASLSFGIFYAQINMKNKLEYILG
jgi:hypothetical protein